MESGIVRGSFKMTTNVSRLALVACLAQSACNVESPNQDDGPTLGTVTQSLVQSDIQIQNYNKSALPAPAVANAGRLAKLNDYTKDLWMDVGSQWVSLTGEVVDAKVFGAKGDGSGTGSAERLAIQGAIDSTTSGTVYLPPGTYVIDAPLIVNHSVTIRGAGVSATTIKYYSSTGLCNQPTILVKPSTADVSNVSISDLTVDGNRTSPNPNCFGSPDSGSAGVEVRTAGSYKVNNVSLTNMHITRTTGDGVTLRTDASVGGGATTYVPTHVLVANNFIDNWMSTPTIRRNGVAVVDGQYVVIANNRFTNLVNGANAAIDLEPNNTANEIVSDVTISGNVAIVTGSTGGGIFLAKNYSALITRVSVTGNVMNVPGTGLYIGDPYTMQVTESGNVLSNPPVELENVRTLITKSYADNLCGTYVVSGSKAVFTPKSYANQTGTYICSKNLHTADGTNCRGAIEVVVRNDNSLLAEVPPTYSLVSCSQSIAAPWPYGGNYITQPDTYALEWNVGTSYVVCCGP